VFHNVKIRPAQNNFIRFPTSCQSPKHAGIMGKNLGIFEEAVLTATDNVLVKRGMHTLIENKVRPLQFAF